MKTSLLWGTYGKYRELPLTWRPVTDLATDHIIAILVTQPIPSHYHDAFVEILTSRGYRWIGPEASAWRLRPLEEFFHAPGWLATHTHHPYPGESRAIDVAERASKAQFYSMLAKLVEGPMFALELK
jgi:hypothetical protein